MKISLDIIFNGVADTVLKVVKGFSSFPCDSQMSTVSDGIGRNHSGIRKLIDYLLQEKAAGNKLILWTCRAGKALTDATEWCCEQGLTFDAVNDNLPEIVELYGNNSRKITCDLYIDDKSAFIDSMGRIRGAGL